MKQFNIKNNLKALSKLAVIISLAVFQVSFFLNQSIEATATRKLAEVGGGLPDRIKGIQASGINTNNDPADEGVQLEGLSDGDEDIIDDYDLIPEDKLPKKEKISEAFNEYDLKLTECKLRPEDIKEVDELAKEVLRLRADISDPDYNRAYSKLVSKLVFLGLLDDFKNKKNDTETSSDFDISDIKFGSEDEDVESAESSVYLSDNNPDDLKDITDCHLKRLNKEETAEDQRAYYKIHIAGKYEKYLAENFEDLPEEFQKLTKRYTEQAQNADQATDNQNAFIYSANAYTESSIAVNALVQSIKELERLSAQNPNDITTKLTLERYKTNLGLELERIKSSSKTNAANDLRAKGSLDLLPMVHESIDVAVDYWSLRASNYLGGAPIGPVSQTSVTPSVASNGGQYLPQAMAFIAAPPLDNNSVALNCDRGPNWFNSPNPQSQGNCLSNFVTGNSTAFIGQFGLRPDNIVIDPRRFEQSSPKRPNKN